MYAQDYLFTLQGKTYEMLTADGKDYVVIDMPNKSKEELYKQTLAGVSSIFNSPKDVISKIENEEVAVFGIVFIGTGGFGLKMSAHAKFVFQFKDNKIRINAPSIQKIYIEGNGDFDSRLQFKSNGGFNPKKKLYASFHENINNILLVSIKEQEDW